MAPVPDVGLISLGPEPLPRQNTNYFRADLSARFPARTIPVGSRVNRVARMPRRKTRPFTLETAANNWRYDLVAVGASAGGLLALTEMLRPLPPHFPGIVVVQHLDPMHKSHLASLLMRKTS